MTTPTPRERLADAVKALDEANDTVESLKREGGGTYASMNDACCAATLCMFDVIHAARALLAAPDDAAELRAVKALVNHVAFQPAHWVTFRDGVWGIETLTGGAGDAPTAVELCRKLEVSYE